MISMRTTSVELTRWYVHWAHWFLSVRPYMCTPPPYGMVWNERKV